MSSLSVDVGFDPITPIDALLGDPDCWLDASVVKPQTDFRYLPLSCVHGADCGTVRAGIFSLEFATAKKAIADGLVYTCRLTIPADLLPGSAILLDVRSATATDPDNRDTDITASSTGGRVEVTDQTPVPTATGAATSTSGTSTPTMERGTPTATPTNPLVPTPTATAIATPSATSTNATTQVATPSVTPVATSISTRTGTARPVPTSSSTVIAGDTRTPVPTREPTGPPVSTRLPSATRTAVPTLRPTITPGGLPCTGDCNRDGDVLINEIITGVDIGLGVLAIDACTEADGNGDSQVGINEVIAAVSNGLLGC